MTVDVCFYDDPVAYDANAPYDGTCALPTTTFRRKVGVGRPSIEEEERLRKKRLSQHVNILVTTELFKLNDWSTNLDPNKIKVVAEDDPIEVKVYAAKQAISEKDTTTIDSIDAESIKTIEQQIPEVQATTSSVGEPITTIEASLQNEEDNEITVNAQSLNEINVFSEVVITNKDNANKILTVEAATVINKKEEEEIEVHATKDDDDNDITEDDAEIE